MERISPYRRSVRCYQDPRDLANEGYTTEANANGVWEVPVTKDLTAPEIVSVEVIEGGIRITFTDAHYVAYAKVYGNNDVYYDNGIFEMSAAQTPPSML